MKNKVKITVYSSSEFLGNVTKVEGYLLATGRKTYAQFTDAPFVSFIPARKRNGYTVRAKFEPYLLVLEGWGHPDTTPLYGAPIKNLPDFGARGEFSADIAEEFRGVKDNTVSDSEATVRTTTHDTFDVAWKTDFDKTIAETLKTAKVLIDCRHTVGTEECITYDNIANPDNSPIPYKQ